MTPLEQAFANAADGWPQFPVRPDKRPYPKFVEWESRATTSAELISTWGTIDYPGCLWATTPGRVDKTVIDIDRHDGGFDGFSVLAAMGVNLVTPDVHTSLSGKGVHAWYRGRSQSRNELYRGVDRKSVGGYVVTPYLLGSVTSVRTRLVVPFQGRSDDGEAHPYAGTLSAWLSARDALTPSQHVRAVVRAAAAEEYRGHTRMLRDQAKLIHLGREGHGGVPEALDELREMWAAAEHGAGQDPAAEWRTALVGAVKAYGGDVDGSVERRGDEGPGREAAGRKRVVDGRTRVAGTRGGDLVPAS